MADTSSQLIDALTTSDATWEHVAYHPGDIEQIEIIDGGESTRQAARDKLAALLPQAAGEIVPFLDDERAPTVPANAGPDTLYPGDKSRLRERGLDTTRGTPVGEQLVEVLIAGGETVIPALQAALPDLTGIARLRALYILLRVGEASVLEAFVSALVAASGQLDVKQYRKMLYAVQALDHVPLDQLAPAYARASLAADAPGPTVDKLYQPYLSQMKKTAGGCSEPQIEDVIAVLKVVDQQTALRFIQHDLTGALAERVIAALDVGDSVDLALARIKHGLEVSPAARGQAIKALQKRELAQDSGVTLYLDRIVELGGKGAVNALLAIIEARGVLRAAHITSLVKCGAAAESRLLTILRETNPRDQNGQLLLKTAAQVLERLESTLPNDAVVQARYHLHGRSASSPDTGPDTGAALAQAAKKLPKIADILARDYLDTDAALHALAAVGDQRALEPLIQQYEARRESGGDTQAIAQRLQLLDPGPRTLPQKLRRQRPWADEYDA
jgi:hypothetical protein